MKNKTIYFHIGPGKTGTSAIQAWLQNNQAWLKDQGIMYPPHPLDENEVSSGNLLKIIEHNAEGEGHLCLDKCRKLIEKFEKSDAHTLLLSSEWFFVHIESILDCGLFPDAKVIAYLRDPIELIESNYNQSVKRHGVFLPLSPSYQGFPSLNVLGRIAQKHGNDRVILRPYHHGLFYDDNIITDILHSIGVTQLPKVEKKRINPSYQFEALEFKRLLNSFPTDEIQSKVDRILQQYSNGTTRYTLLDNAFETRARQAMTHDLTQFVEQHNIRTLDPFIEQLKAPSQKPPLKQQKATAEQLTDVAQFLEQNDRKVFNTLYRIIEDNRDFYLDTPEFWVWFNRRQETLAAETSNAKEDKLDWKTRLFARNQPNQAATSPLSSEPAQTVTTDMRDLKKLSRSISNFKKRLNLPPNMKEERILAAMALFATEQGQYEYADQLYLKILSLDPLNTRALTQINTVRTRLRQEKK